MAFERLLFLTALAASAANVATAGIIDIDSTLADKVYSANGQYAIWPTRYYFDNDPYHQPGYFALVISGPDGLKAWDTWWLSPDTWFVRPYYEVLITNSGKAVMSWTPGDNPSMLFLLDYQGGSQHRLDSNYYLWETYRGPFRDPDGPDPIFEIDGLIYLRRLTDTRLTAKVEGAFDGEFFFEKLARWDLTTVPGCRGDWYNWSCGEATVIPEPGTYLMLVSGGALLVSLGRRRRGVSVRSHG